MKRRTRTALFYSIVITSLLRFSVLGSERLLLGFARGQRRRMRCVPFAPDTVGADAEELHLRSAVVSFTQCLEKRAVLLEADWVGIVWLDARFAPRAALLAVLA
jgi:hypothetical protein